MGKVTVRREIIASLNDVWQSWDAFGEIWRFHPGVESTRLLDPGKSSGIGARRRCELVDGVNYLEEEIVDYDLGKRMVVDVVKTSVPFKTATATINFLQLSEDRTEAVFSLSFIPKMGVIGKLMTPWIKRKMAKDFDRMLAGNAKYVEDARRSNST